MTRARNMAVYLLDLLVQFSTLGASRVPSGWWR